MSLILFTSQRIIDINECASNENDCEQQCFNSIGSYKCGCDEGCEFNETANTCQG